MTHDAVNRVLVIRLVGPSSERVTERIEAYACPVDLQGLEERGESGGELVYVRRFNPATLVVLRDVLPNDRSAGTCKKHQCGCFLVNWLGSVARETGCQPATSTRLLRAGSARTA